MTFRRNSGPGRLRHGTLLAAILISSCLWAGITGAAEPPAPAPVDAIGPQRLALLDAVRMALAENTDIRVVSYNPKRAMEFVKGAESAYDPSLVSSYSNSLLDRPTQSVLDTGSLTDNVYSERRWAFTLGLKQPLPVVGGTFTLSQVVDMLSNNSTLTIPNPQNTSRLTALLALPLLQGNLDVPNQAAIRIAKANAVMSDEEFRQKVMDVVSDVVRTYWQLVFDRDLVRVSGEVLGMAEEVYRRELVRLERGLSKTLDVERAKASVENRRGELLRARNRVSLTTQQLRLLIHDPAVLPPSDRELIPMDVPTGEAVKIDVDAAVQTAMKKRPEVIRAEKAIEVGGARRELADNKSLPKLDAKLAYTINALGTSTSNVLGKAYDTDHTGYTVALEFEWPIGNRGPRSEYRRAAIEEEQLRWELQRVREQAANEVHISVKNIRLSHEEILSAGMTVEAARKVVVGETARFELGQSTNTDLLQAQDFLGSAEREHARALASYNVSLAALTRAEGTILEEMGVELAK
jgi:outer membrane protein TolC